MDNTDELNAIILAVYYAGSIGMSISEATGIALDKILRLFPESKSIKEIFKVGDGILEVAEHGDYSNGNKGVEGTDEGTVRTWELLNKLINSWQALKKKEGVTKEIT